MSLNISDFSYIFNEKTATPSPRKKSKSSQQKLRSCQAPLPFFEDSVGGSTPPPPQQKKGVGGGGGGGGVHTMSNQNFCNRLQYLNLLTQCQYWNLIAKHYLCI